MKRKTVNERFWEKVDRNGPFVERLSSCCWIWKGATVRTKWRRYGQFNMGEKTTSAYRAAYELRYGSIPEGGHVLHKCDNSLCVRPSHLYVGTHGQNMRDRNQRGRASGGNLSKEEHPNARLTQEQVDRIRELYEAGQHSQYQLAKMFKVTQGHISNLVRGKRW